MNDRTETEADPTASAEWNNGCDFAMIQLCRFLGVDHSSIHWDAATETVDGDVQAVIGNILRAKFGEDWGPSDGPAQPKARTSPETETLLSRIKERIDGYGSLLGEPHWNPTRSHVAVDINIFRDIAAALAMTDLAKAQTSPVSGPDERLAMAETIHKARWPASRQMEITPFADEDRNGREYCLRIADAVLAHTQKSDLAPTPDFDPLAHLVTQFSAALLEKLRAAEVKYGRKNDWLEANWQADCQRQLLEHVVKGDPRDVAAYAAFCWHHGWPTALSDSSTLQTSGEGK